MLCIGDGIFSWNAFKTPLVEESFDEDDLAYPDNIHKFGISPEVLDFFHFNILNLIAMV